MDIGVRQLPSAEHRKVKHDQQPAEVRVRPSNRARIGADEVLSIPMIGKKECLPVFDAKGRLPCALR